MAETCESNLESIKTYTKGTKEEIVSLKTKVSNLETKLDESNKRKEDLITIVKSIHDEFIKDSLNLNYDY